MRGRVGLVGGSGISDFSAIEGLSEEAVDTPFGSPSDSYFTGTLAVPITFFVLERWQPLADRWAGSAEAVERPRRRAS